MQTTHHVSRTFHEQAEQSSRQDEVNFTISPANAAGSLISVQIGIGLVFLWEKIRRIYVALPVLQSDLDKWRLKQCQVENRSDGIDGGVLIPVFQILESRGFEVKLITPTMLKPYHNAKKQTY